jgi:hypothetical protein
MKVKEDFLSRGGSFTFGNGEDTGFLEDTSLGNKSLAQRIVLFITLCIERMYM